MKTLLLDLLICPSCLPDEQKLSVEIDDEGEEDILTGTLRCPQCHSTFPITHGIANLDPGFDTPPNENKYESTEVVSSYLWSHYCDLLDDEQASDAYLHWSGQILPHSGVAVDTGSAVGRFTFEMGNKADLAIGIDTSAAFIKTARELKLNRQITFTLKEEGFIGREATISLPDHWRTDNVEFIMADVQKLPFKSDSIATLASLNLIDKVPIPMTHLKEMNRVTHPAKAQFLLSDPFSWSTEAAEVQNWLGGKEDGQYGGKAIDNIIELLQNNTNGITPSWQIEDTGYVWWKIRTHANHYELIKSCYLKASR